MSISGIFLILFLPVHAIANLSIIAGEEAFNSVCDFMNANPAVRVMVPVLAFGLIIHILYGFVLSIENYRKRGKIRYAVPRKTPACPWAGRNMAILGILILCALALHLENFWSGMQLREFTGREGLPGYDLVLEHFQNPLYVTIYLLWFAALWLHLSHGFWSAFHTLGWNNDKWFKPLQVIAKIYATAVCGAFAIIPLWVFVSKFP